MDRKEVVQKAKELVSTGETDKIQEAFDIVEGYLRKNSLIDYYELRVFRGTFEKLMVSFNIDDPFSDKRKLSIELDKLMMGFVGLLEKLEGKSQKIVFAKHIWHKDKITAFSLFTVSIVGVIYLYYSILNINTDNLYLPIINFPFKTSLTVTFLAASFTLVVRTVFLYLNLNNNDPRSIAADQHSIHNNGENKIINQSSTTNIFTLSSEDKDQLLKNITSELGNEVVQSLAMEQKKEKRYEILSDYCSRTAQRLIQEIKSLNQKANTNLSIGVGTTLVAVGFLVITSLSSEKFSTWFEWLAFYIPRFSLSIFIELFSFYFLSLYKANLNEIKYYQNEMTDIDFKLLAFKNALLSDDEEHLKLIANELMKADRNRVMKKDETTIELERIKHENWATRNVLNKLPDATLFKDLFKSSGEKAEEKETAKSNGQQKGE